jgi:hypothetical protein
MALLASAFPIMLGKTEERYLCLSTTRLMVGLARQM